MVDRVHEPVQEPSAQTPAGHPHRHARALAQRVFAPRWHLRARRWLLARGKDATRLIGSHPFFAGWSGTIVATVMAALTYAALYNGRAEELRHAAENSANIVRIVTSDIARNVELYDLSLRAVVSGAQQPDTWTLPEALRQRMLFDRATAASFLGGAYVLDAQGHVKASQSGVAPPDVSFADRDYFVAQARDPNAGLFISKPYVSRLRHGVLSIALSRRIDAPDGAFVGVALLGVRLEYFQQLIERIDVGRRGGVFIIMQDGTLLASKPMMPLGIGANYASWHNYRIISQHDAGTFTAHSEADGVERVYTYAHVGSMPIIVGVAPAVDDILASWRRRSWLALAMTTVFGGAWVAVSWILAFALRDKVRAEAALQRLAVTDGLTGLANRRALDERLISEWQRAARTQTPLAVLFLDIDHFKIFNDTYGHAAGDEVLALVAERIASGTRRAADMTARYGGEEFAVVLPATPLAGAQKIAEKIRRRVEAANLANSGSRYGRVTVSVGCASCEPPVGGSGAQLLAAADALLYEAKSAGRNQVRAKQWNGTPDSAPAPGTPSAN
ncbi:sensor domain-containing diguanylate cyclase [Paraburkholderia sp. J67]|uniref:sensor domain-containing diguanylate cyclase n=1 Tax=Paraburkholderia sp. J67 TaxID=2805435 RepID=UPI002ABDFEAA|nr:sensor domain-containing diguanylate cyclase [Paraburkholderia sp. J67]